GETNVTEIAAFSSPTAWSSRAANQNLLSASSAPLRFKILETQRRRGRRSRRYFNMSAFAVIFFCIVTLAAAAELDPVDEALRKSAARAPWYDAESEDYRALPAPEHSPVMEPDASEWK